MAVKTADRNRHIVEDYVLENQIGYLMRRASQRHAAIFFEGLKGHKLTPTQFAALVKIEDEGEVSQNRLGRLTAMDPATILGVVKRLRERRLIDAKADPTDRRRSLWHLSCAGRQLLLQAIPYAADITRDTLAPLNSKEQKTFLTLLQKLA